MTNAVSEVLSAARELIADPEHWTQGTYAIENTGNEVYPDESNAYAFCSAGALAKASGTTFNEAGDMQPTQLYDTAYFELKRAALALFGTDSVTSVNDGELKTDPETAHPDVLAMFEKAIADSN
jgi:hypothetical protein